MFLHIAPLVRSAWVDVLVVPIDSCLDCVCDLLVFSCREYLEIPLLEVVFHDLAGTFTLSFSFRLDHTTGGAGVDERYGVMKLDDVNLDNNCNCKKCRPGRLNKPGS